MLNTIVCGSGFDGLVGGEMGSWFSLIAEVLDLDRAKHLMI